MVCDGAGSLDGVFDRMRIFGLFSSPVVGIGGARDKRTWKGLLRLLESRNWSVLRI